MAYPFSLQVTDHILSGGTDSELFMWTLAWDVHALTHHPWSIFEANIFHPHPHTLAYSENLIGSGLLIAPVIWLTGDPQIAMNVLVLLATLLSALGAHLLACRLGLSVPAAVIAGLVFGFAPARLLRMDQVHMATLQWMPFALAYLHTYFDTNRPRDLRIAAAFFSAQAVTSGHGAAFLALGGTLLIASRLLRGTPVALVRRVRDLGLPGALLLVPAALIYQPYRAAGEAVGRAGLRRTLDDWTLPASSFVTSPAHLQQWIVARLPDWEWLRQPPDAWLFPGILPLVLGAAALHLWRRPAPSPADAGPVTREPSGWRLLATTLELGIVAAAMVGVWVAVAGGLVWRVGTTTLLTAHDLDAWIYAALLLAARIGLGRRVPFTLAHRITRTARWCRRLVLTNVTDDRWLYAGLALLTIWFAIGPPFGIWGWVHWLPGLSFVRVPSRFILLGILALAVLAAFGFDRLTRRLPPARRIVAAGVVGALLLVEAAALPVDSRPYRLNIPEIDRWLDTQPKPFVVAEIPVPDSLMIPTRERRTTLYMLHSTAHFQKTVHGYSGIQPPGYPELYELLMVFPNEESLRTLHRMGVTYVVVHPALWPPTDRPEAEVRFETFRDWLPLVHTIGEDRVHRIVIPDSAAR